MWRIGPLAFPQQSDPLPPVAREEVQAMLIELSQGDRSAVRARFEGWNKLSADTTDAMFDVWDAAQNARMTGRHGDSRKVADLLDELAAESRHPESFQLVAQTERLKTALSLGNLDDAATELARVRSRALAVSGDDPISRWARAFATCEEVNYALGADDFDRAIVLSEPLLEAVVVDPATAVLWEGLLANHELALVGQARRDPSKIESARERLRRTLEDPSFRDVSARMKVGTMLIGLDLRVGDLEAAQATLDDLRSRLEANGGRASRFEHRLSLESVAMRLAIAQAAPRHVLATRRESLKRTFEEAIVATTSSGRARENGFLHFSHMIEGLCELIHATLLIDDDRAALEVVLSTDSYARLAKPLAEGRVSVDALMRDVVIDDRHAMLCFVPGTERSHFFVITKAGVRHFERPDTAKLKQEWQKLEPYLHRPLSSRDRGRMAAIARTAADSILGMDVIGELTRFDALSLHAPAGLGDLPFEHLAPNGTPLGHSHAIDRIPNFSLAVDLARRTPTSIDRASAPNGCVLELTSPKVDARIAARFPSVGPLGFNDAALAEVTASYGRALVDRRQGGEATPAVIGQVQQVRVLSILAHGVWLDELNRPAAIALAPSNADGASEWPGLLLADAIETAHAPWLVTLGVCGAGAGPRRLGNESALDLGGAFLFAGAGAVVLARGRVEADSTRRTLARFHHHVAAGETPAEALRRARVEIAAIDGAKQEFHACLFEVVGSGQRSVFQR